jgi:hypothetical protein
MVLGNVAREWRDMRDPIETFAAALAALRTIGKVDEVDDSDRFLRGTTRYGLQTVRLKVRISPGGDRGSLVTAKALADDIWGWGARRGLTKLRHAMEE